jgi:hypothetical protein
MKSLFAGQWIGESMGIDTSPAHLWRIEQQGRNLYIYHRWEGEVQDHPGRFWAYTSEDSTCFYRDYKEEQLWGELIDPDHYVLAAWDTNDVRGHSGPAYDVVFSRPGVAELESENSWRAWQARKAKAKVA